MGETDIPLVDRYLNFLDKLAEWGQSRDCAYIASGTYYVAAAFVVIIYTAAIFLSIPYATKDDTSPEKFYLLHAYGAWTVTMIVYNWAMFARRSGRYKSVEKSRTNWVLDNSKGSVKEKQDKGEFVCETCEVVGAEMLVIKI